MDEIVASIGAAPAQLVPLLQAMQAEWHYLPAEALRRLSERTSMPLADITSVATYYGRFRLRPCGRHTIRVCIGTACHIKGAERIFDSFRQVLQVPAAGDTDPEGLFTIEQVACLGCCMLAPAIQIDSTIYGPVAPEGVAEVLRDFLATNASSTPAAEVSGAGRPAAGELRLCTCSSCRAAGADRLALALRDIIAAWRLPVALREVGCQGASHQAPLLDVITPTARHRYGRVQPDDAQEIIATHFRRRAALLPRWRSAARRLLDRLLLEDGGREPPLRFPASVRDQPDAAYWCCQTRLATDAAGEMAPLDLDGYLARDGFTAFASLTRDPDPPRARQQTLDTLAESGLRGRGGGGFPTARKWLLAAAAQPGAPRFAICNGDEGDPGAFMDRMLLESFPYRVLEGLAIAAWTIGAAEAILYIRQEYPLAVARARAAIDRCAARGLLGGGTPEQPTLQVIEGAGAFVCGEETALLAARGAAAYRASVLPTQQRRDCTERQR